MDLDKFSAIARGKDWLEEPLGFSMDVDHAVYTESKAFKLMAPGRPQSREAMVFELEWLGQGDGLSDIDADFFRMYGKVAEDSQFVSRSVERDIVLLSGHARRRNPWSPGDVSGRWPAHRKSRRTIRPS